MADEATTPLSQRQSGRQQRRAARMKASTPQSPAVDGTPARRGPSEEIEKRIAESLAKRKKSNVAAAAISADYEEADYNEILGTYEYLDHTADIQLHSWGDSLESSLEQLTLALFGYMTKISLVEVNESNSRDFGTDIHVQAHDLTSLVFNFLQEWLCIFHESGFVPRTVTVHSVDLENYTVVSSGKGETMKPDKHVQGTEVKAVTYSNLQVIQNDDLDRWDIWVILDI